MVKKTAIQLEIPGIGQQLATLDDWKAENLIFTHNSGFSDNGLAWSAWGEIESPHDFGHEYSFDSMGYGSTEKDAIVQYCAKVKINPPFWW